MQIVKWRAAGGGRDGGRVGVGDGRGGGGGGCVEGMEVIKLVVVVMVVVIEDIARVGIKDGSGRYSGGGWRRRGKKSGRWG